MCYFPYIKGYNLNTAYIFKLTQLVAKLTMIYIDICSLNYWVVEEITFEIFPDSIYKSAQWFLSKYIMLRYIKFNRVYAHECFG